MQKIKRTTFLLRNVLSLLTSKLDEFAFPPAKFCLKHLFETLAPVLTFAPKHTLSIFKLGVESVGLEILFLCCFNF